VSLTAKNGVCAFFPQLSDLEKEAGTFGRVTKVKFVLNKRVLSLEACQSGDCQEATKRMHFHTNANIAKTKQLFRDHRKEQRADCCSVKVRIADVDTKPNLPVSRPGPSREKEGAS
jgi:hypothetical protein